MRAILLVAKTVKMTFVNLNNNYDDGNDEYNQVQANDHRYGGSSCNSNDKQCH